MDGNRDWMNKKENLTKSFLESVHGSQRIIHKVCRVYRDDPEDQRDLYQEIVYQLWRSYPSFKGEAKVSSWIYRVALNTALASYRKRGPSIRYMRDIPESIHPSQQEPGGSDREEQLFAVLRKLDDAEKMLMTLYLEDYSYKEISEITGLTENNIGVRLSRIKNKLRQHLQKK
jgi:RNA polymerase sigma-70 factor (ECF subfamily)